MLEDPSENTIWFKTSPLKGDVFFYRQFHTRHPIHETALTPEGLGGMIQLIENGTISSKIAKQVFKELIEIGGDP
ncbi:aspartyl-tRNA(Asn) amidotransferase subunit B /glutamyl-tRNA(Gln) amidotransferase subunit B [Mesobacillus selenatarsenatis SF-1]|uniref:Aspartyl-tRNA(Asn) amidotransferase subunit B /glutamyl-tRNA(Gln) amidotransferase subunit B n=1 Tax=Mesobacillus selenatarsenatis (strain DSM 18680 / JCM 14380 / FERM P-15431 / SF-1) TaxID=1321606 RepID=A0A0A8X9E5_MESS1|nr:aspartyl-tRNA(Asn) amidotransferase subunit B /glutamyl-tRNA(Gln) amidotransferase subunit B [Mesobacillus selenatarsenatis SF-1]